MILYPSTGLVYVGTVHFLRGRGGGGLVGFGVRGVTEKKTVLKGGNLKQIREKGGHVKYFSSALRLIFLTNMSPQKQTKKVFKSIRDVPSAFNNVSTTTDYNFKATELNRQNKVSIFIFTQFLSLSRYCWIFESSSSFFPLSLLLNTKQLTWQL